MRRRQVWLDRCLGPLRLLLRCGFDALRRVPSRERQGILRLDRPLARLCLPIQIRQVRTRLGLQRLEVHPRLDEDESPVVTLLFLLAKELLTTSVQFFRAGFEEVEIGTELEPEQDQYMRNHRQQHTIPTWEGAADDKLVLVPIFEVEMYQ